jgi:glycosyltransferase involved in cell wall biosynthesis
MTSSITLAHPAPTPFVQQVGRALFESDLLNQFATTIVYRPEQADALTPISKLLHYDLVKQLKRRSVTEFPMLLVQDYPIYEWLRLLVAKLDRDQRLSDFVFHWSNNAYDRWVARHALVQRSKAMIFLCEHETQGIAYQQALSCGVPILAWDRGGFWQDPSYFPHRVQFQPVSSVPYWDDRCGLKFTDFSEFSTQLEIFLEKSEHQLFSPRDYILEHLTLAKCAQQYLEIWKDLQYS